MIVLPFSPKGVICDQKREKREKKKKTALVRLEPGTFTSTVQCSATELLGIDISSGCRLFNIKYIIIIASLIYEPHLLIKISTVNCLLIFDKNDTGASLFDYHLLHHFNIGIKMLPSRRYFQWKYLWYSNRLPRKLCHPQIRNGWIVWM